MIGGEESEAFTAIEAPKKHNGSSNAIYIASAFTFFHIFYIFKGEMPVSFDEAQYWAWSKVLDWGYYSKPPLVAFLIRATTTFCGDGAFCIRLSSPLLHFFTSIVVFLIAKYLYDERIAFWSCISYISIPAVTISSTFITTDAPLIFFWSLSIYCFIRVIDITGLKWWLFLGISVGLGMLGKYTMIAFFPSAMMFFLTSKLYRHYLFRKSFWFSIFVATAVFMPNILWNYDNGFVSLSHTGDNVFSQGFSFYPIDMLKFLMAQVFLLGPILFCSIVLFFILKSLSFEDSDKKLALFIIPLFFVAIAVALISGAQAHWAAPVFVPALILAVKVLVGKNHTFLIKTSVALHIVFLVFLYNFSDIAPSLKIKYDPFARISMWNTMSSKVSKELYKFPNTYLMTDERKSISSLVYNLRLEGGKPYPVVKWNAGGIVHDYYDMTTDMNLYIGKNFVFVTRESDISDISKYFEKYARISNFKVSKNTFYLFYMKNFKGY